MRQTHPNHLEPSLADQDDTAQVIASVNLAEQDAHFFHRVLPHAVRLNPEYFMQYPLPLHQLSTVIRLRSGAALKVLMMLHHLSSRTKRLSRLVLDAAYCKAYRITPHIKSQGLNDLERLGMIEVVEKHRTYVVINMKPWC